ncbi:MAG TPA: alpha-glucan family phosphorylase [Acidimicrobiales bacterium]|nr:alpha-glucan family phosphorylase [Acidimicrobiales bacterium]
MFAGDHDVEAAVGELAARLPEPVVPLARVAFNYAWSWAADGPDCFAALDPDRWMRVRANPVRMLRDTSRARLSRAASDPDLVRRIAALSELVSRDLTRPAGPWPWTDEAPIAFMCAEFGVHSSLPVYSGGLGVLAGDLVKEASDLALPLVGVGLLYRSGYFHQRIDTTGMQHEYWIESDPTDLPCVPITDPTTGDRVTVELAVNQEGVVAQLWRVDVGRVPLVLLDTDRTENSIVGRWITSRLYEGNRAIRLAQYAVLGVGGVRALAALGVRPSVYHLNEGHPALAAFELLRAEVATGKGWDDAWAAVVDRLVFTTHTPVPAGNETYGREEILQILGRIAESTGDPERFLSLGRLDASNPAEPSSMTVLGLRASRSANGVSRRHGEVARAMWHPLFPDRGVDDVPITSVTNGVHVPTWLSPPMRALFDRHLGDGWLTRADDPSVWAAVDEISDDDLWHARCEARRILIERSRLQAVQDRLRRGEDISYVEAAAHGFDPDRLTIGFARRLATYKRLYLLSLRPDRALGLLGGDRPVQFVFAGKAHPLDDGAKAIVRDLFQLKRAPEVADRVAFLEDYDLSVAGHLVAGCDVWVNVPRPPEEASGTSGMKAALNGVLNLSVLDGWWAEAYDGTNGWAIDGDIAPDVDAQDQRHADALFDLLEHAVVPLFHDRDPAGIPRGWLAMVRANLRTNGPRFAATRMLREYADRVYARPSGQ